VGARGPGWRRDSPPARRAAAGVSGGERGVRVEKKWAMEDGYIWRKYE
jgi:hypothetical protein